VPFEAADDLVVLGVKVVAKLAQPLASVLIFRLVDA